jgi:hypothetical protein
MLDVYKEALDNKEFDKGEEKSDKANIFDFEFTKSKNNGQLGMFKSMLKEFNTAD